MIALLIYGIIMMLIGVILILYSHKIVRWMNRKSLLLLRIAPWLNFRKMTDEQIMKEWDESALHYFEIFYIWLARMFGVISTGMGLYLIYSFVFGN